MAQWQVGANADDAHERSDDTLFSAVGDVNLNSDAGANYYGGFRFTGVNIPQGANILSASIELYFFSKITDDINVDIHAEDEDDPNDFSTEADVVNRAITSASAVWAEDGIGNGVWDTSPSITSVIQEVVNRPGYNEDALVIICRGRTDATKNCQVRGHDTDGDYAAKLNVTWGAAAAGGHRDTVLGGAMRGIARGAR